MSALRVGDRVWAPTDLDIIDTGTVVGVEDRHGRVRVRWDDSGMLTDVRPRDLELAVSAQECIECGAPATEEREITVPEGTLVVHLCEAHARELDDERAAETAAN